MYYLTKTVYSTLKIAGFAAGFFYMFNFFALDNRENIGFLWTYAFLPLLLALFVKIANATYQKDKSVNKNIFYFALTSVVAFSFASINPANLALLSFGLGIFGIYYVVKFRKQLRQLLVSLGKIAGLAIPINLWWIIPVLNYYVFSSQALNSSVNVSDWSWTHIRASFLNLFWLNGFWGWSRQYVPTSTFNWYSNPFLVILVFVPFLVAASALFFKSEKSRFNLYIMGSILVLLFLASGLYYYLYDPHFHFGELNWLLYQYVPLMSMFREPISKFTLLTVPFLALLIGYAVGNLANVKFKGFNFRFKKVLAVSLLLLTFVASVYPLINNPLQSSAQVKIPDYWYQATDWINSQPGSGKVLLTPLDDFYQMPYNWTNGYYGTDQLIDSLIDKPIISTDSLNSYKINNDSATTLLELGRAIRFGKIDEFNDLLNVLSVKYVLQRNDIDRSLPDRNTLQDGTMISEGSIMSPDYMKIFFANQSYLQLMKTFGNIDIYEYTNATPSFYTLSLPSLQESIIAVQSNITLQKDWNFSDVTLLKDWQFTQFSNNIEANSTLEQENGQYIQADLNATWNQGKIESLLLQSQSQTVYEIAFNGNGHTTSVVNVTVVQYIDESNASDNVAQQMAYSPHDSNRGCNVTGNLTFEPLPETKYFRIQVWFNDSDPTYPSWLKINDIKVTEINYSLDTNGLNNLFNETQQKQTSTILRLKNVSPTKMVVTVNATHPFILATSYALDNSWIATVDGNTIKPTVLYLGLEGFQISKTGQFTVTIEYKPQTWFYFASGISIIAIMIICGFYTFLNRDLFKNLLKNKNKKIQNRG